LSKVLVVVNGSESSIAAVKYALALGKNYGAKVMAVYVVDTATIRQLALSRIFVPDESAEYETSLEASGRRILSYVGELAANVKIEVETMLRKGAIAGEVIALAEDIGSDCILLGESDHASRFRDLLMDVNVEIARGAPCSVLLVKGKQAEQSYRSL
jgi:nucleotide-binding universal stress UspA family protein